MGKLDKGFAIGAVVFALVIGGVLFMVYPASFNGSGYSSGTGGGTSTSTASVPASNNNITGAALASNTVASSNGTASQNQTVIASGTTSTQQPASNSGY